MPACDTKHPLNRQHTLITATTHGHTDKVPPGPQHNQIAAQLSAHIIALVHQIIAATLGALSAGIHYAFIVSRAIYITTIVLTLLLKDAPPGKQEQGALEVSVRSGNEKCGDR